MTQGGLSPKQVRAIKRYLRAMDRASHWMNELGDAEEACSAAGIDHNKARSLATEAGLDA